LIIRNEEVVREREKEKLREWMGERGREMEEGRKRRER